MLRLRQRTQQTVVVEAMEKIWKERMLEAIPGFHFSA